MPVLRGRALAAALVLTVAAVLAASQARADCTAPNLGSCSTAGEWIWDATNTTFKFCNGTNWISMAGYGTLGTCSTAGVLAYNSSYSAFKFCNGTNWIPVGNGTITSCVGTTEGQFTYNSSLHKMKYCNGTNWIDMTAAQTYLCTFVTSTTYSENLGGVSGANADCAARATAAGFPGTYKAWIAVTTGIDDPATTFLHGIVPYKLVDGTTTIANDWTDLTDGTLTPVFPAHGINQDDTGASVNTDVYTNVATDGTAVLQRFLHRELHRLDQHQQQPILRRRLH